jgi:hypothetical protein
LQIVQYNIIRTELRKISSQLTEVVNVAKHRFLEVCEREFSSSLRA